MNKRVFDNKLYQTQLDLLHEIEKDPEALIRNDDAYEAITDHPVVNLLNSGELCAPIAHRILDYLPGVAECVFRIGLLNFLVVDADSFQKVTFLLSMKPRNPQVAYLAKYAFTRACRYCPNEALAQIYSFEWALDIFALITIFGDVVIPRDLSLIQNVDDLSRAVSKIGASSFYRIVIGRHAVLPENRWLFDLIEERIRRSWP